MNELGHKMSGVQRTALFLLTIGEEAAAEVLKRLDPKRLKEIVSAMKALNHIDKERAKEILEDFVKSSERVAPIVAGSGEDYLHGVITKALGKENVFSLIGGQDGVRKQYKFLESLRWIDPQSLANSLAEENPQITANILALLDSEQASKVISFLPQASHRDILLRISLLDGIKPLALKSLDDFFKRNQGKLICSKVSGVGGAGAAANILNFLGTDAGGDIVDEIRKTYPDLGDKIEDKMFVFDNLMDIDGQGLQALLQEVPPETLALALKGADDELKDNIISNLPKRSGEAVEEELEHMKKVRLRDVEAAQKEILTIARRMADSGELILGGKGGDEYI